MSLAINRQEICDAEFYGFTVPSQCAPGPSSRFYYEHDKPRDSDEPYFREAFRSYIDYDPDMANRLLDEIGLTKRDLSGYRIFPDGTRLMLFVETYSNAAMGPLRLMVRHWARNAIATASIWFPLLAILSRKTRKRKTK